MIVDTTAGKIEGVPVPAGDHGEIFHFRGIPYARAERFRPPASATPWTGIRDGSRFGPMAPQNPSPTDRLLGITSLETDEDCLVLNVCTPAVDHRRRPVLVWIHGGGFTGGSGHLPHYDPGNLVRAGAGDLVVVTINYRLGALGFLRLDDVLPDFRGSALNGIHDQVAALRWVRDNIESFGGDPHRVTVFGESAGGMSVATLLGTPRAGGLFHGAIAQSGAADRLLHPDQATWVTEQLLHHLDLTSSTADALLQTPPGRLVDAQTRIETELLVRPPAAGRGGPSYLQLPFQPVVDGTVVPRPPTATVRAGDGPPGPLVVGTTRDEWRLFMLSELSAEMGDDRLWRRTARLTGPDHADEAVALYRDARPDDRNTDLWCSMVTDFLFRMPAVRLAEARSTHTDDVAMYRFDHPSAAFGGLPGACHAIDVPFVFDNVHLPGIDMLLGGADDGTRRLARRCARAWAVTAAEGRPDHDDLPWPAYEANRRATCILDREPTVVDDPDGDIRRFWSRVPPT